MCVHTGLSKLLIERSTSSRSFCVEEKARKCGVLKTRVKRDQWEKRGGCSHVTEVEMLEPTGNDIDSPHERFTLSRRLRLRYKKWAKSSL